MVQVHAPSWYPTTSSTEYKYQCNIAAVSPFSRLQIILLWGISCSIWGPEPSPGGRPLATRSGCPGLGIVRRGFPEWSDNNRPAIAPLAEDRGIKERYVARQDPPVQPPCDGPVYSGWCKNYLAIFVPKWVIDDIQFHLLSMYVLRASPFI